MLLFSSRKNNFSDKEPKAAAHSSQPASFFEVLDVMASHVAVTSVHNISPRAFISINVKNFDCAPGKSLLYFTQPYVSAITPSVELSDSLL